MLRPNTSAFALWLSKRQLQVMALTLGGFMALNGTISGQQLTSFVLYTVRAWLA